MATEILFLELTKVSATITTLLLILLVFYRPPSSKIQKGYRITLRAVILAMILVTLVNGLELFDHYGIHNKSFILLTTLIVSSYQIFIYSATIITMLKQSYYSPKRVLQELAPTTLLSIFAILFYLLAPGLPLKILFIIFGTYFGIQIVHYSREYLITEKETIRKIDNFFSEELSLSLKWTRAAFAGLLFCSVLSLFSLIQNHYFSIVFTICYTAYYTYFTIHYFNFINSFRDMEPALAQITESNSNLRNINRSFEQIEQAITHWESKKMYTEPGITIEQVSIQLKTNRTYLSNHMNTYRKVTFKEWINGLRIDEAKRLLQEHPSMPVSQIGVLVGIPDKSNFGRQFTRFCGMSPQTWRKK
jgi:AraC-like DNA-binding protein